MTFSIVTRRRFLSGAAITAAAAASASLLPGCATHRAPAPKDGAFKSLFDGKTLKGWRGLPEVWSVQDSAITGRTDQPRYQNTYLIYDEVFRDFELRFKYRFPTAPGNSGLQYRSRVTNENKFIVAGYQANVVTPEAGNRFGMLYDELQREDVAYLGERVRIDTEGRMTSRHVIGAVNEPTQVLGAVKAYPEWNDYSVIAFGAHLVHVVNQYVTVGVTDNEHAKRPLEGILALQLHAGQVMSVQFKNLEIGRLKAPPSLAGRFRGQF